jgi:exosome complex RNA-binding protein Csl4
MRRRIFMPSIQGVKLFTKSKRFGFIAAACHRGRTVLYLNGLTYIERN